MARREIAINGVWVHRDFEHLSDTLEICVEVNGQWRSIGKWNANGYISHIVEVAGIEKAPIYDNDESDD